MANTRTYSRSFAGGEIAPDMYGRIDDAKFQTGVAKMRNFIAMPQGAADNRPGTEFVYEVKDSTKRTRLIPFTYSTSQTMVLEFGEYYIRFHTNGGTLGYGVPPIWNNFTNYALGAILTTGPSNNYQCIQANINKTPASEPTYWYPLPAGIYQIASPYAEADLFDIHYVQSADVMTLVHPNYPPAVLQRFASSDWRLTSIVFGPALATPVITTTVNRGTGVNITAITRANPGVFTLANDAKDKQLAEGDSIYISGVVGLTEVNNKYYIIDKFITNSTMSLVDYQTAIPVDSTSYAAPYTSGGLVQAMSPTAVLTNSYVVVALSGDSQKQSASSTPASATNNLTIQGSYNTINWSSIAGATRYNVYKQQNSLYGYIGQTTGTSFVDDNIGPDLSITPAIYDTVFASTNNYPGAVSYFEQRKAFAGTITEPQTLWMTRSGSESDMSYSIPVRDDDRIKVQVAVREASTIRHIVPLTQMLMLTNSSELRVSPINSDVITPSTISVRPQSYLGANNVQPEVVNNVVVYCADRGGHVRELGYSWQSQGFITGDLSLRATHLFDNLTLSDMCYAKSPQPILWFISSSGYMLGLTYVPEQQIGAWHWHDTDGVFESCTAVAEGDEDRVYVVVKRTIGGVDKRYIERLASRKVDAVEDCIFVDSALTYDGTGTNAGGGAGVTISGGTAWDSSEVLTLTLSPFSSTIFAYPAQTDAGDCIVVTDSLGNKYRLTIIATSSTLVATARVDRPLPVSLRNVSITGWAWGRNSVSGLNHIEGKTVSILADGAVMPQQVVTGGVVSLQRPVTKIIVGLPYQSDIQTLPMILNIDGFGQGHMKNVNKAWIRAYKSSGIFVGPDADHLVEYKQRTTEPYGSSPALKSEEVLVVLTPSWGASGQVYIRQSDPLPLTLSGMTLEVSIGG
jgi:hypothetical protein